MKCAFYDWSWWVWRGNSGGFLVASPLVMAVISSNRADLLSVGISLICGRRWEKRKAILSYVSVSILQWLCVYAASSLAWHSCSSVTEYSVPHWDLSKHSLVNSWAVTVELLPKYGAAFLMYEDLISWYWFQKSQSIWPSSSVWVEKMSGPSVGRESEWSCAD